MNSQIRNSIIYLIISFISLIASLFSCYNAAHSDHKDTFYIMFGSALLNAGMIIIWSRDLSYEIEKEKNGAIIK
jgi:ABC-type transport system involved in multi-copper enzyme maturation permease subunit